ncbi:TonB-dependent receptor [Sphingobium limneticum]|uniref:TonB-dependent receptor n=1 Tax=Sphingobium limneticum TaxID=1007511 RepID=A0A5J5HPP4_9SPHN|nr:TonB-dependent receptor [Sphingobium limneticum]KAA9008552.1 TonB-dependent receptor [Sphingobium limneticum]KAA9011382.1 TonB-dependent receptor [Sphingobium limneticum]KAA9023674.1 TonB-dependent receptor [Sphingobium limneticum]
MNARYFSGCSIIAAAVAVATPAHAQQRAFDIPAQPLPTAIATLGKQARLQIVAPGEGLETVRSRSVKGMMDARAALKQLIAGTGLEIATDDGARIVLRRATQSRPTARPTAQHADPEDAIVVTGFRASMNIAREIKRKSDAIVDSIAAEDIGQLPDNSATEALARLPGVQIFRNRGEGQSITIRGISQVVTMINGQEAYTGSSRRTLLNSYPAGLIRSMEVYKALTPDLIEGGIGGAVDVQLRQPLDFKKGMTVAATLRGSYDDQAKKAFDNADLLVAGNWDTGAGEIGVMVNASYLKRDYYESYRESLQPQTNAAGQTFPTGILLKNPKGSYERPVFTGEVQWRPAYNFGLHLRATNVTDDNEYTDTDLQTNMALTTALTNVELVPGTGIVKSATFTATADSGPRSNHTRQLLDTTQVELGADFTSGIATLTTNAVYTTSKIETDQQLMLLSFNKAPVIDAVFQSDSKYGGLSYTYRNIDLSDINQFHVRAYSDTRTRQKGEGLQWRTDLNLDTGTGFFRSVKTGVRYARRSADFQTGTGLANLNALNLRMSAFPGGSTPVSLTRGVSADDAMLPGGWVGYDANWLASMSNVKSLNAYVDSLQATKLYTDDGRPAFAPQSAFNGKETSYAAYGQVKYGFDLGGVAIDGVAGARLVNTVLDINGTQYAVSRSPTSGGNVTTYTPVHARQNYLDFDPSFSAVAHFSSALQLRLAWTKTFSRPDFSQLNPSQTFSQVLAGSGAYTGRVTTGNPNLLPIRSTNWDASLEYYYGRAGAASIALFQRDVKNYIVNTIEKDDSIPGALGIVDVTRPINAGDGTIKGIEASVSTFFDFAPGMLRNFGASANYSFTDSKQELPATDATAAFTGQTAGISKHAYNLALFYDDGKFRAKIAYSWRGRFALAYNLTDPTKNLNWYPIERLAASATYNFSRNLSLTIDGTNLTNRPQRAYWGSEDFHDRVYFEGRTYSAAMRFKF